MPTASEVPPSTARARQSAARDLVAATRPFGGDQPIKSWLHLLLTFAVLAGCFALAALLPAPWRLIGSVGASLVMVRAFILFHDHMHGALLRRSLVARIWLRIYGCLVLTPPRAWKKTHDFHHAHVGLTEQSEIGGFRLMTTQDWAAASPWSRLLYRLGRSPLVIVLAYPFVFAIGISVMSLISDPRRHWDSAAALGMHGGLIAGLWLWQGWTEVLYIVVIPMTLASMLGAYLFYAQHSFVGAELLDEADWSVPEAAIASSSYLRMGPLMRWLTGDIGYHHVHHLNASIPFYALADAMAAVPELRAAKVTTLRARDVIAGLRLKLWDPSAGEMVGFAVARRRLRSQGLMGRGVVG